jgi:hypothetical protein
MPSKVAWRAGIVLATAEGCGTNEMMRRTGKSKPCVWRWQKRYVEEGVEGLLRDKTRPPGKKPLPAGECQPRHRAKEFIRFLKRIDRCVQDHLAVHLVLDNYSTHKPRR